MKFDNQELLPDKNAEDHRGIEDIESRKHSTVYWTWVCKESVEPSRFIGAGAVFIYLYIYLFIDIFIYFYLYIYLFLYLFIYVLTYLFIDLFIYLFNYLFIYLFMTIFQYTCIRHIFEISVRIKAIKD